MSAEQRHAELARILARVIARLQQKADPIREVLYPEERRLVLELLVDEIDVSKTAVTVQFRADGIEQIATELEPIGERNGRAGTQ
jgi:hypothetical protein